MYRRLYHFGFILTTATMLVLAPMPSSQQVWAAKGVEQSQEDRIQTESSTPFSAQVPFADKVLNLATCEQIHSQSTAIGQEATAPNSSQSLIPGKVLFEEDFNNNQRAWSTYNQREQYVGVDGVTTRYGNVKDGSYQLELSNIIPRQPNGMLIKPTKQVGEWEQATTGSYQIEVTFSKMSVQPDPDGLFLEVRLENKGGYLLPHYFSLEANNLWSFYAAYGEINGKGDLPSSIDLLDMQQHTIIWNVENWTNHSIQTLVIDGIILHTAKHEYTPFHGPAEILFGFGGNSDQIRSAQLQIDKVAIRQLTGTALTSGAGTGSLTKNYTPESKRLLVQLPAGWYASNRSDVVSQVSNGDINNVRLFNAVAGFTGARNEMAITIHEPVYVMESSGVIDSSKAKLDEVLINFLKEEVAREEQGQFSMVYEVQICEKDSVLVFERRDMADVFWAAFRNSDNTVTIMEAKTSSQQIEEFAPTLFAILETVDYVAPPKKMLDLDRPAFAAKQFVKAMTQMQHRSAVNMLCWSERLTWNFFMNMDPALNPIRDALLEGYSLDDSYRYYETVKVDKDAFGKDYAVVRVSGHAIFTHPDGRQVIKSHSELPFKNLNAIRLEKEFGVWRVCEGFF